MCCAKSLQSCLTLSDPMNYSPPGSSVHGIREEYWNGLLFPTPGNLPDPGIKLSLLSLLHWQAGSLPPAPPGKPSTALRPHKSKEPALAALQVHLSMGQGNVPTKSHASLSRTCWGPRIQGLCGPSPESRPHH